ncbi:MAG: hypothetical protein K2W92_07835 [Alphaproteobacteria bacterium]|nr:hypothetical protein [Alphaproteobacteria bacterium]
MFKILFIVMSVLFVLQTLSVSSENAYASNGEKGYFLHHDENCSFGDQKACIPRIP